MLCIHANIFKNLQPNKKKDNPTEKWKNNKEQIVHKNEAVGLL